MRVPGLTSAKVGVLLLCTMAGWGQEMDNAAAYLHGHVTQDGGALPPVGLLVQLDPVGGGIPLTVCLGSYGQFELSDLEQGDYQLQVTDAKGTVLHRELITLPPGNTLVAVRLPARKQEPGPSETDVVSVGELRQRVPGKAAKELRKSEQAFDKGDLGKSIWHLQAAIRIYPDYVSAHNNLGVDYSLLDQCDKAAGEFRKALALDPAHRSAGMNLASVLLKLGRFKDAEGAARQALRFHPDPEKLHLVLGLSLAAQHHYAEETLDNLRIAENEFPEARLVAAQVLKALGKRRQAADELSRYLDTPAPQHPEIAKAWLARLQ